MTHKEFKELAFTISTASSEELDRIGELMRKRRGHIQEISAMSRRVGDRVRFDANTRGIVLGEITKINRKTVKVMSDEGVLWTVSPSLLESAS